MLYKLLKLILFKLDAEDAHNLVIKFAHQYPLFANLMGRREVRSNKFNLTVGRNTWSFPVGLAAGLDKNGLCIPFFKNLGFGAVEVGTVTPRAQIGNLRPRLHRILKELSLLNSMGFNNGGAESLELNLAKNRSSDDCVGINIGKNKDTPDSQAYCDYQYLYKTFNEKSKYIVINVSSPNTPGLRNHQSRDELSKILSKIDYQGECDLFVKISPDIAIESLDEIIETVREFKLTGIIATNTTINEAYGQGGVSGKLLFEKSSLIRNRCLEILNQSSDFELIGVGGFSNFEQMKDYWSRGGRALQIYSSFIFQGPKILIDIENKLLEDYQYYDVTNFEDYLKKIRRN